MTGFDPYTAQKAAEAQLPQRTEAEKAAFEREEAAIVSYEADWDDWDGPIWPMGTVQVVLSTISRKGRGSSREDARDSDGRSLHRETSSNSTVGNNNRYDFRLGKYPGLVLYNYIPGADSESTSEKSLSHLTRLRKHQFSSASTLQLQFRLNHSQCCRKYSATYPPLGLCRQVFEILEGME
ncbi:uncharacterized protein BDZ99DRAFT_52318 [Mytilinidion resinicola]|uniref:Uncharacterized protein n=1 Tax=Mytilinidion resinicola TaxID=574789 RepID=A0A6A6YIE8_9PEZI|nr:uncharacterized protein BDZ99DRAFT_52318 [Mytilinidion resinicola]KAF2808328.1 hypothetical protein BDZ99DRAFT_52318 [Mytilinidion resinicola]